MVQDYNPFEAGMKVAMIIKAQDIQVMKKERTCNTFEGKLVDETHVEMLGIEFECLPQALWQGEKVDVLVDVDFDKVDLLDDIDNAELVGDVRFILYKGDHYFLTVMTEDRDNVYVATDDVWDERDLVGIKILPEDIRIRKAEK